MDPLLTDLLLRSKRQTAIVVIFQKKKRAVKYRRQLVAVLYQTCFLYFVFALVHVTSTCPFSDLSHNAIS